jgi:hypothetical protein
MLRRHGILLKRIWSSAAGQFGLQRWVIYTDLAVSAFRSIADEELSVQAGAMGQEKNSDM